jgi:hypothetical protein
MAKPTRPEKKTTTKGTGSVPKGSPITTKEDQVPVEDVETIDSTLEPEVDKDAMIAALQAELSTAEEQKQKIADLQRDLAAAEKKSVDAGAGNSKNFKRTPDPGSKDKFYYFDIIWHPKRSDSDEECVTIGVNGKLMTWARGQATVIRSDYLEVADNAFVPKFKQLPGEDRKEIGGIQPFTYTINRKITEQEYIDRKKEGDKALRDDLLSKGISM